jgi:hypothetical protein
MTTHPARNTHPCKGPDLFSPGFEPGSFRVQTRLDRRIE